MNYRIHSLRHTGTVDHQPALLNFTRRSIILYFAADLR